MTLAINCISCHSHRISEILLLVHLFPRAILMQSRNFLFATSCSCAVQRSPRPLVAGFKGPILLKERRMGRQEKWGEMGNKSRGEERGRGGKGRGRVASWPFGGWTSLNTVSFRWFCSTTYFGNRTVTTGF